MSLPEQIFVNIIAEYIRWVTGNLPKEREGKMEALAPMMREAFGCSGTWQKCVEAGTGLNETARDALRGMWENNKADAKSSGKKYGLEDFIFEIIRDNFGMHYSGSGY
jgi:hypothetical protein